MGDMTKNDNAAWRPHTAFLWLGVAAWLALAAAPAGVQAAGPQPDRAESVTLPGKAGEASSSLKPRAAADAPAARKLTIAPVAAEKLAAEAGTKPRAGAPQKIGFARDVAELADPAGTAAFLVWQPTAAGGLITALSLSSPQAAGLRAGLVVSQLPAGATLRFYPQGAAAVYEVPARDILATLQRNRAAGDDSLDGRTYWSPHVEGAELTVEIELPPGVAATAVELSIPRISHFFASPLAAQGGSQDHPEDAAQSCNIDVNCEAGWSAESNAVARMTYVSGGSSYLCSGTLLADTAASQTPYFLSANHCISTQSAASTLQTYWFYRSTSCNSGVLNPAYQTLAGGATLLYQSSATDTSFMRLLGAPPAGSTFAGWLGSTAALGSATRGVHHPKGDLQKITSGQVNNYLSCVPDPSAGCTTTTNPSSGNFLQIPYLAGITEGGSSGSGLFVISGASHYLIGQLWGSNVNSNCATLNKTGTYGRFDVAYGAALSQWLNPAAAGYALSVSKSGTGSGTVSSSPAGINCGATCSASFAGGTGVPVTASPAVGSVFTGWSGACSGSGTCNVTMNAASAVTATFTLSGLTLGEALDNTGLVWTAGGNAAFLPQTTTAFFGGSSAQSGALDNNQSSFLSTTVTGPGTLSWYWRVSSEANYDIFSVSLDGAQQYSWSGEGPWTRTTLAIPAGAHTVRWDYVKDVSLASGQDAGWVDFVVFAGASAPQTGWWWNPLESGRGFFLEVNNNRGFLASFLYATGGRATWYAATSGNAYSGNTFAGTLDSYSGGQTLTGAWQAPAVQVASGGNLSIAFSDARHGVLTWAGGSVPIQRFEFAPNGLNLPPSASQPETGWWWNPSEGGRGFSMEIQGSLMFIAGYMYDSSGNPIWYIPEGTLLTPTSYQGVWTQYAGGQTLSGPYQAPTVINGSVGALTIQFSSSTTGVMTLPDGRQILIERFRF